MDTKAERQCASCGATLGAGRFCEKCGANQEALSFDADVARMLHSGALRSAKSSLLWVAILTAFGTIASFGMGGGEAVLDLGVGLGLGALYLGLWHWSKQQPLGAAATGLGIFVTLHVGSALVEPASIANGVIVKIIILVLLIRGVRAGVVLRSHGVRAF